MDEYITEVRFHISKYVENPMYRAFMQAQIQPDKFYPEFVIVFPNGIMGKKENVLGADIHHDIDSACRMWNELKPFVSRNFTNGEFDG